MGTQIGNNLFQEAPAVVSQLKAAGLWYQGAPWAPQTGPFGVQPPQCVHPTWGGGHLISEETREDRGSWGEGMIMKVQLYRNTTIRTNIRAFGRYGGGGRIPSILSANPGREGKFRISPNGNLLILDMPPDAAGLEHRFSGIAYLPRAYVMRWAVVCSGLNGGFNIPPTERSCLRRSELRRGRVSRHGVPMFRFWGKDGPFDQEYGLHFCFFQDSAKESAALSVTGIAQPATPRP